MSTRHIGFFTIAAAITLGLLLPQMARAEGEEYLGDWSGTYYSNGQEVRNSQLRFYKDSLGVLDGDWDGYPVAGWRILEGGKLQVSFWGAPKGGAPQAGIDHYIATCEIIGGRLKIEYVGRSSRGVVIRSGGTHPGGEFRR